MVKMFISLLIYALTAVSAHAQAVAYNGVRQDIIIDVRTPIEFAFGHINGAINIPFDRIDADIQAVKSINKDSRILLYCRSGRRSETARTMLEKQGYKYVLNSGGMGETKQTLKSCDKQSC